jgi:hypothetical protein
MARASDVARENDRRAYVAFDGLDDERRRAENVSGIEKRDGQAIGERELLAVRGW